MTNEKGTLKERGVRPRVLYLHVGHGKTGTTWLQAIFRTNRDVLAEHGIEYPMLDHQLDVDEAKITSGNGGPASRKPQLFRRQLRRHWEDQRTRRRSLLLSNEWFAILMPHWPREDGETLAKLIWKPAARFGFDEVRVLMFIRHPVGYATSAWQQVTKRDRNILGIDEWFARDDCPQRVVGLLDDLSGHPRVRVTVRNYSVCKSRLMEEACDWLGIGAERMRRPAVQVINRSLTRSENALMLALNRSIGPSAMQVADALCERLPDIPADVILPSLKAQQAMWERNLEAIEAVNRRVDPEQRYVFDGRDPGPEAAPMTFSAEQIAVIGDAIGIAFRDLLQKEMAAKAVAEPAMSPAVEAASGGSEEHPAGSRLRKAVTRLLGRVVGPPQGT